MQDRLKFRVWDNRTRRYDNSIALTADGFISLYIPSLSNDGSNDDRWTMYPTKQSRYQVEQCTGLLDKHGTLIYEKDTVNYGGAKDLTIEWFDGGFHFVQYSGLSRPKTQPLSESNLSTVEIIGNIHQKGDSDE